MLLIAGWTKQPLRITLMMFALVVLSGCESLPAMTDGISESGVDQVATITVADARAGGAGAETHELRRAIDLLQDGRLQQGRSGLVSFLKRNPTNQTARSLLRQIDTDPTVLLGEEHELYTVRPRDTLGELADRFLGDGSSFLALARYNDIQRPRVLYVGQTLKIPLTRGRNAEHAVPSDESAVEIAVEPEIAPAVALEPTPEPAEPPPQDDTAAASGESAAARAESATPLVEAGTPTVDAEEAVVEAKETAIDEVGPSLESVAPAARAATAPVADATLIARYHQAAIVHFRNQELEEAVALWDQVLALDPGFEPARAYRMRAQELKRRLEALGTR